MPGPQQTLKKKSDSHEVAKPKQTNKASKKVRLICADPDATDSSSDGEQYKFFPKRLVREVFIPPECAFSSSSSENEASFSGWGQEAMIKSRETVRVTARVRERQAGPKKALQERKTCGYTGVRKRKRGKWAAEFRDASTGIRMWLGTFDSAMAAAKAYDAAAKKLKGPFAITNFAEGDFSAVSKGVCSRSSFLELDFLSPNDSWSFGMADESDDDELLPACSNFESWMMNSPSSVLDNGAASQECESPTAHAPSDKAPCHACSNEGATDPVASMDNSCLKSVLADRCNISYLSAASVSLSPLMVPGGKPSVITTLAPPLSLSMKETPCFGGFGQTFNATGCQRRNDETGQEGSDLRCDFDDLIEVGGHFTDMNFDLDSEALGWIST